MSLALVMSSALAVVTTFVLRMRAQDLKIIEAMTARIDTLEARISDQASRIAELESDLAIAHSDRDRLTDQLSRQH